MFNCFIYVFFLRFNRDDILFVEIEHGKGITKFRDDEGNYWHLVE